jgi:hypothetical protein
VPAPTRGDLDERSEADYEDLSALVTPIDPVFPKQIAGVARADGIALGGVRH